MQRFKKINLYIITILLTILLIIKRWKIKNIFNKMVNKKPATTKLKPAVVNKPVSKPVIAKPSVTKTKPVVKTPIKKPALPKKPNKEPTLTKLEKDALKEIGFIGARHAAKALSEMLGHDVEERIPLAGTITLTEIPKILKGREKIVTAINLPVKGDVNGSALVFFPQKSALVLTDLVMKKKARNY